MTQKNTFFLFLFSPLEQWNCCGKQSDRFFSVVINQQKSTSSIISARKRTLFWSWFFPKLQISQFFGDQHKKSVCNGCCWLVILIKTHESFFGSAPRQAVVSCWKGRKQKHFLRRISESSRGRGRNLVYQTSLNFWQIHSASWICNHYGKKIAEWENSSHGQFVASYGE